MFRQSLICLQEPATSLFFRTLTRQFASNVDKNFKHTRSNKQTEKSTKTEDDSSKTKTKFINSKSITYQFMNERKIKKSAKNETDVRSTVEILKFPSNARSQIKIRKETDFFSKERLNIFDPNDSYANSNLNRSTFWEKLQLEELNRVFHFPPENPFDELIQLTEEGKLWQYPINNEQGLEEDVPFYEHVLLENLLEGFPDKGPVRQFMELVITGLSHNPYITVERKHETVLYYKKFFEEKNLLDYHITEGENSDSLKN